MEQPPHPMRLGSSDTDYYTLDADAPLIDFGDPS
jgi:NADH-quinone oxidoreductase subunit I